MTRSQIVPKYPKSIYGIKVPSIQTLKKYGLSFIEWKEILKSQGFCCFICEKVPKSGILCIDHEHVKNWKKMKPEKRKEFVRGLLCSFCNFRMLPKGMTKEKSINITRYFDRYFDSKAPF